MITDQATMEEALSELNYHLHAAIIAFKNKAGPGVNLTYIGTITGTDYLVPNDPILHISSSAVIEVAGQKYKSVIGDY